MTIDQAVDRQRAEDVERGFNGEPEKDYDWYQENDPQSLADSINAANCCNPVKRDPERYISETERKWREENGVA